jgi:hypothetical protein
LEQETYDRTWTDEEVALGFVGDVGDLMKLVLAQNGVRNIPDADRPFHNWNFQDKILDADLLRSHRFCRFAYVFICVHLCNLCPINKLVDLRRSFVGQLLFLRMIE